MTEIRSPAQGSWFLYAAIAFMFLGTAANPMFFACSMFLLAARETRRDKTAGILVAAAGLAFLLLVLGYGFGKDMALKDNVHPTVEASGRAS